MSTIAFGAEIPVMSASANLPFPSCPDDAAMLRLSGGDDRGLDEIMARWSPRVVGFLQRVTGDHAAACDLAQECFVRLYLGRGRYRAGGNFGAYLFKIAANLGRNRARWKGRHPEAALEEVAAGETAVADHATPDREAEAHETADAVREAVLALPEDLRLPLVLSVYEGERQEEIAEILGCSRKTVETRIYRARQILRARLSGHITGK